MTRLVLLTDGQTQGQDACRQRADEAGRMGIPIIALGLGHDWNESLLLDLSQRSDPKIGYADLINQPQDVGKIFQELFSQMKLVAQNVSVRLLMIPGLEARRVWQVTPLIKDLSANSIMGHTVQLDVPELAETGGAFLVEMIVPARPLGAYRLAQAELCYALPRSDMGEQVQRLDLMATVTNSMELTQQVNGQVMNIVERVTAFQLQTQALQDASKGHVANATRKLRAAHTRLLEQGELELAQNALEEAERLEQGKGISNKGRKTIKLTSRKTIRLSNPP